jgi:hypothetical protein
MTGGYTRAVGALLLVGCWWWVIGTLEDVSAVSPIHWGLLLPHVAVVGFPAVLGTVTAGAMLLGRSGVRSLFLGLAVAAAQAAAISYLSPDIERKYHETVRQGRELSRDSAIQRQSPP